MFGRKETPATPAAAPGEAPTAPQAKLTGRERRQLAAVRAVATNPVEAEQLAKIAFGLRNLR